MPSLHREDPGPRLRVLTTQEAVAPEHLQGDTVVVFDVLLATTTLVTILENGARRVFAAGNLHDAEQICGRLDADALIRGGEQNALNIDGYDRGPFPAEYDAEFVSGKDVVFVSTNGTRALARAASAGHLLVGSVRNAPAVARHLNRLRPESVWIVCAGTRGGFSLEDFVGAGLLVSRLDPSIWRMNDAGWLARDLAERYDGRVAELLRKARAARWFLEHRREDILDFVGDVGASELVAEVRQGELLRIVPAADAQ